MNNPGERYYRDSGAVPFAGTLLMVGCGVVAAGLFSIVYGFLDYYNPFIYLTGIGTVVLGVGTGAAITFGSTLGKVRNRLYARIVGAVVGSLAVYMAWVWYLWAAQREIPKLHQAIALHQAELSFDPSQMLELIRLIADEGLWSIAGATPSGIVLYALWFVEAGIIFGFTYSVAAGNDSPFCEPCNEWTDDDDNLIVLQNTAHAELVRNLEDEQYERLEHLRAETHDPHDCLLVTLHICPNCDESNYLSITHVLTTVNKKDEEEKTEVIKNLWIHADLVDLLRTAPPTDQETAEPPVDSEDEDEPLEEA